MPDITETPNPTKKAVRKPAVRKPKFVAVQPPPSGEKEKSFPDADAQQEFMQIYGAFTKPQQQAVVTVLNYLSDTGKSRMNTIGYRAFFRYWRQVVGTLKATVGF